MRMLQIGSRLAAYRLEAVLGRGGMGIVYLGEDERLKRKVAVKVIAPELAEDPEFRERFLRESRLAASLDHPNVIPVYEAGAHEDVLFLVMRYVDGSDLRDVLLREGRLPVERAVRLISQAAGALDAAHAKGLVHRDVKPGNMLVSHTSGGDHLYLTDFGLTKQADSKSLSSTGQLLGTLDYAAPEQIQGGHIDRRTDVYALGCVLYQCLVGTTPYKGTEVAVMWSHLQEPAPLVSAARDDVSPELDSVIATAMAKRPEQRYATCGELARAAAAGASAPPLPVRRQGRIRRGRPSAQRPRIPKRVVGVLLLAAVLVAAAITAIVAAVLSGSPGQRAAHSGSTSGAASPGPLVATTTIDVEPFTTDAVTGGRLRSIVQVVGVRPGRCWEHSLVTSRPDAYRCIATDCSGNAPCPLRDPCFTPPALVREPRVACPAAPLPAWAEDAGTSPPWSRRYFMFQLHAKPPGYGRVNATTRQGVPEAIQLLDGARCLVLGNGRPLIAGQPVNYRCEDGSAAVGDIRHRAKVWTINVLPRDSTQMQQTRIRTAWF